MAAPHELRGMTSFLPVLPAHENVDLVVGTGAAIRLDCSLDKVSTCDTNLSAH